MDFLFKHDHTLEKQSANGLEKFDYNCNKFLIQEIDLRQQIDEAKRLLKSLNKISYADRRITPEKD